MRYDLAFFLCCCKSFLSDNDSEKESFYDLLGVERDASHDDIKKAYKKMSLKMHRKYSGKTTNQIIFFFFKNKSRLIFFLIVVYS